MQSHPILRIALAAALLQFAACGGGGNDTTSSGGGGGGTPSGSTPLGGVVNQRGETISQVSSTDPVRVSFTGLDANAQYTLHVESPTGVPLNPDGGFIATTDEDGALPTATILQDLGTTSASASKSIALWKNGVVPQQKALAGNYSIAVHDASGATVLTDTFTVTDGTKVFCADSSGTARASFLPSEAIFAVLEKGASGTLADGAYNCYVTDDLADTLADGDHLSGAAKVASVAGGTATFALGTFDAGAHDVICDLNGNGTFEAASDVVARPGRFHPCFTVQTANSGAAIVGQICADRNGNYRDLFDPNATDSAIRDVFAWITPRERSLVQHATGVRKYVVTHHNTWTQGDALSDVTGVSSTGAFELDAVQAFCTNESPWLVWPRQRLVAGCYDCIIDVNANGVFDAGTDFVDNIDSTGDNATCGMRVANSACSDTAIVITSPTAGDTVDATSVLLTGTASGAVASGSVIIAAGAQSNTVHLTFTGSTFSANIPLFHGKNVLTVSGVQSDGTSCAKTIDITSTATASAHQLFRAQMTWDGDTDMDLHLVKPSGVYANGGGGAGDCNYANCKVGLDGSGANSIDWGAAGEDDDPKLDVDCIACGNGIENIWMNHIVEDGDYRVYVDAFSGNETAVSVTLFVKGSTVGTVSCGAMNSGTATDSCFVGTIHWTGGASGSGTFTADGSTASTF